MIVMTAMLIVVTCFLLRFLLKVCAMPKSILCKGCREHNSRQIWPCPCCGVEVGTCCGRPLHQNIGWVGDNWRCRQCAMTSVSSTLDENHATETLPEQLATCWQCGVSKCQAKDRICDACWNSQCIVCMKWHKSLRRVTRCTHPREGSHSEDTWLCKYCRQTTTAEEAQALSTASSFTLWVRGRREDSIGYERNASAPQQPAKVLPWLFLGDYDDATNLLLLKSLGIAAVLSFCPEKHPPDLAETHLANGIELVSVRAWDDMSGDYDIISEAWPRAREQIASWKAKDAKVLVNCWGGVNRSSATIVAWLLTEEGYSLRQAMHRITTLRGTVLTNWMFRLQLLRLSRQVPSPSDARMIAVAKGLKNPWQ